MSEKLPDRMRVVQLQAYYPDVGDAIRGLRVVEKPLPHPRRGEVLIRVAAAPCNPSDLLLLQGKYGSLKTLPTVPGWEGAGRVVASGGGLLSGYLRGRRVACGIPRDCDGTWAEYCVARAAECIPLKGGVPFEQAAGLIINPLTAMGMLETAQREGHAAAVHTAAASQLGRILLRLASDANYPVIAVVRRDEQIAMLKELGARVALNSTDPDFPARLADACRQWNATVAWDAVGGPLTGTLLECMPPRSTIYLYGALSEEGCGPLNPIDLIFHDKRVAGFYLAHWIERRGLMGTFRAARRIQRLIIQGVIEQRVQRRVGWDDVAEGLHAYVEGMSEGKVLLLPHGAPT